MTETIPRFGWQQYSDKYHRLSGELIHYSPPSKREPFYWTLCGRTIDQSKTGNEPLENRQPCRRCERWKETNEAR